MDGFSSNFDKKIGLYGKRKSKEKGAFHLNQEKSRYVRESQ